MKKWGKSGKLPGESCTFVIDNYAGQNKHRMMLRFPMRVIDMDIYKKIEVIYLIAGHTKMFVNVDLKI